MDLILWRHAEAEEGANDLARELTPKGKKQAARVAEWLLQRLPSRFLLIASPAARAQQTAQALGTPKIFKELAPGAAVSAILKATGWPDYKGTVVLVGHQPDSNPEEMRRTYLQNQDAMRQIESQVLETQAIDWVLGQAKVTEKAATFSDVTKFGQAEA